MNILKLATATPQRTWGVVFGITTALIVVLGVANSLHPQTVAQEQERQYGQACRQDWTKCTDNADIIENHLRGGEAKTVCKDALAAFVKYGTPEYRWGTSFGTYLTGNDYLQTGIAKLIDEDVQISNGFGAKAHSDVECWYDMHIKKAIIARVTQR